MTSHELNRTTTPSGSRHTTVVRWADRADSEAILAFQERVTRCAGQFVALNRAPDLMRSYETEGSVTKLLVGERYLTREITSCAALSYKELYLNGSSSPCRVGYLGSLLTDHETPRALKAGFSLIDSILPPERPVLWLTTILRKNTQALRTLGSGRSLFGARYSLLGLITTFVVRARALLDAVAPRIELTSFTTGSESLCSGALRWHGYPAPVTTSPGAPSPLWHSLRQEEHVRATGALFDCRSTKRWRVQSSSWRATFYSLALRLLSVLRDVPALSDLKRIIFLHGVTAHPDDKEAYRAMLGHLAYHATLMYGRDAPLCFGVHETNPFFSLFDRIPALRVESCLFRVSFPDDMKLQIDERPWHIDVGGL
jgi:hypothetical protein